MRREIVRLFHCSYADRVSHIAVEVVYLHRLAIPEGFLFNFGSWRERQSFPQIVGEVTILLGLHAARATSHHWTVGEDSVV